MVWSPPDGYEVVPGSRAPGVTLVVARRARAALLLAGIDDPERAAAGPAVTSWVAGGRVRHPVIEAGGERWLFKAYRRGGLLSRWNADRYLGAGRFLRELETAVAAARAGVPVPEPIALVLHAARGWPFYRAWQVVRYEPGVTSLREILDPPAGERGEETKAPGPLVRGAMLRAAGSAVRRMHEVEIDHPDLNVGNILVRPGPADETGDGAAGGAGRGIEVAAEAFIVDWDRARRRQRGSWNPHRNLLRLWRSALKLARLRRLPSLPSGADLRAFLRGYFGRNRDGLRRLRGYVRSRRPLILLHLAFWQLARAGRAA